MRKHPFCAYCEVYVIRRSSMKRSSINRGVDLGMKSFVAMKHNKSNRVPWEASFSTPVIPESSFRSHFGSNLKSALGSRSRLQGSMRTAVQYLGLSEGLTAGINGLHCMIRSRSTKRTNQYMAAYLHAHGMMSISTRPSQRHSVRRHD